MTGDSPSNSRPLTPEASQSPSSHNSPYGEPIGVPTQPNLPPMSPDDYSESDVAGADLNWVWTEVRKRVFIKLPFSRIIADALEAIVPIALEDDIFICGLSSRDYMFASQLHADQVRNTIESILRNAAGRAIRFEVIEGITREDWLSVRDRRQKTQDAVIAIHQKKADIHHYEDVLNQIIGEIRQQVSSTKDRLYPQVRAGLVLDIAPTLAAAEEMLFDPSELHDARRALARAIDRVAGFLEMPPLVLAMEIERAHRSHGHAAQQEQKREAAKEAAEADSDKPAEEALEEPSVA